MSEKVEGSGYSIGDGDFSQLGMASLVIPAINVTLFRPYLWEANSALMLLSALEATFFLFLFLKVLLKLGAIGFFNRIIKSPLLSCLILFTVLFAFGIGAVTFNFGALVRYKIPILSPFIISLLISQRLNLERGTKLFRF